jgi:hypothetical protein
MIVPDALVALKCFLPEGCCDKAVALLEGHVSRQGTIAVPEPLFDLAC